MNREDRMFFGFLTAQLAAGIEAQALDLELFKRLQFRLNWTCPDPSCAANHVCRGTWEEIYNAIMVMAPMGFPHMQIRLESYAMEMDARAAEEQFPSNTPSDAPHQP